MNQTDSSPTGKNSLLVIIQAGLAAGALDAIAATTLFMIRGGKDPAAVWRYVASGVFGKSALATDSGMAVWGLVFHFGIALTFAAFFVLIYPQLRQFIKNPVAVGLLYGLLIWVIMNRIVLPLSNVAAQPFDPGRAVIGLLVLMIFVGLPISFIVHKHYSVRRPR